MNQLNSTLLEGTCMENAVLCSGDNTGTAKVTIGVKRIGRDEQNTPIEEVSYFDIYCYGKLAELALHKCKRNCTIRVVGRLKQERWNSPDGKSFSKMYVVAEHIEIKPKKKSQDKE